MQPKIRDAEMRKHHALAGQAEERRRLENLQQQKDELEQQMVSWQSIYVIINIGILNRIFSSLTTFGMKILYLDLKQTE